MSQFNVLTVLPENAYVFDNIISIWAACVGIGFFMLLDLNEKKDQPSKQGIFPPTRILFQTALL